MIEISLGQTKQVEEKKCKKLAKTGMPMNEPVGLFVQHPVPRTNVDEMANVLVSYDVSVVM